MSAIAIAVLTGMWMERFVIIVISLYNDYLPSSWMIYKPTLVDLGILLGSFGFFFTWVLLFSRTLPVIGTTEVKRGLAESSTREENA
jgi:molybdopterin-containing oxidoreductase family membrane subunit